MGSTGHYDTNVADLKKYLIKQMNFKNDRVTSVIVDHNDAWALQQLTFADGRIECIPVWLNVWKAGEQTIEKLMDATCHPFRYDCPAKFLKLASKYPHLDQEGNVSKYFAEWLEIANKPKPAKVVIEFGKTYLMTSDRKVQIVGEYNKACWVGYIDGCRYRIKKNTIKALAE